MQAHQVVAGVAHLELLHIVDKARASQGLRIEGIVLTVPARGAEGAAGILEVTEVKPIPFFLAEHDVHAVDVRMGVIVSVHLYDVLRLYGVGFTRLPVPIRAGDVALEEGRLVEIPDGVKRAEQGERPVVKPQRVDVAEVNVASRLYDHVPVGKVLEAGIGRGAVNMVVTGRDAVPGAVEQAVAPRRLNG